MPNKLIATKYCFPNSQRLRATSSSVLYCHVVPSLNKVATHLPRDDSSFVFFIKYFSFLCSVVLRYFIYFAIINFYKNYFIIIIKIILFINIFLNKIILIFYVQE